MLKSISYWSMPGGLEGHCAIEEAFQLAKKAGFEALELAIGPEGLLTPETDKATCLEYKKIAEDSGLAAETLASGMSWALPPTHPDPAVRAKSIEIHTKALQRAAWLGCEAMLFVPGAVVIPGEPDYKPVRYDLAVERARHAVIELGEVAADLGVQLAVENVWNGLFYSPLEFAGFIDEIGNPAVGIYFDIGNILNHQQWPPHWIALLNDRIVRVHLKDFQLENGTLAGFCDLSKGDIPWKETIQALRDIGYNRTLTAEMMPPAPGLLERTAVAMNEILAL